MIPHINLVKKFLMSPTTYHQRKKHGKASQKAKHPPIHVSSFNLITLVIPTWTC